MANPITWQNVTQSDWSNDGSANAALVAESLSGIGDTLRTAHEDKSKRLTGAAIAEMAGLTNRESYADDAAGIMGGLDQRYADMDAIAKFQQKRGNVLQLRQEGDLDIFKKQFENANLQEMHDVEMAHKKALSGSMSGNSPLHQKAAAYVTARITPDGVIDEDAVNADMPDSGLPIKLVNEYITQYKSGSPYYRQQAQDAVYVDLSMREQMKSRAAHDKNAAKFVEAPANVEAGWGNGKYDAETKLEWSFFYQKLRKAGASDVKAREIMEKGMDYDMWSDNWEVNDELKQILSDYQNRKKANEEANKKPFQVKPK